MNRTLRACPRWLAAALWLCLVSCASRTEREDRPAPVPASDDESPPWPSTFSIVGHDPASGDLGVAVASRFLAVGSVVPWVEDGVGAVATQSYANTSFGPRGLVLLRDGWSPREAVERLLGEDPEREFRQVGMVDAKGRSFSATGGECIGWAGSRSGEGYAVQGNILVSEATVDAMVAAFGETRGELAERLLAALEAGDQRGGDSRGRQSAALLVARKGKGYGGFNARYVDLRVDDHADPVGELRRLLQLHLGRDPITMARAAERRGDGAGALAILEAGLARYAYWHALRFEMARVLLAAGKRAGAKEELGLAISTDPLSPSVRMRAARILLDGGLEDEALEEIRRALRLEPEYAKLLRRELESPSSPFRPLASELGPLLEQER